MSVSPRLPSVFVLGSSLTIHFGPYLEKELSGRFRYDRKRDASGECAAKNLDIPQGAAGGDSSMVLAYLRERRLSDPIDADILVLSCGLHDIKTDPATGRRQVAIESYESNLREILREAALMRCKVAWLRITPVNDAIHNARSKGFHRFNKDVDAYNAVADRLMAEAGAEIIDFHAHCRSLPPESLIDHVHYNEEARQKQAAFIATELFNRFPSPSTTQTP